MCLVMQVFPKRILIQKMYLKMKIDLKAYGFEFGKHPKTYVK